MKRNRSNPKVSRPNLEPLTERILARMGPQGQELRQRLQSIYQRRGDREDSSPECWPLPKT